MLSFGSHRTCSTLGRARNPPRFTRRQRGTFSGCEASLPRESHTLHLHSFLGCPRNSQMGDHPVFRYPVFRERCTEGVPKRPRRWGWGCKQPRGLGQAESISAREGFRTSWLACGGRRPWLGDCSLFRGYGLQRPLIRLFWSPTSCAPEGVRCRGLWMLRIRGEDARVICRFAYFFCSAAEFGHLRAVLDPAGPPMSGCARRTGLIRPVVAGRGGRSER